MRAFSGSGDSPSIEGESPSVRRGRSSAALVQFWAGSRGVHRSSHAAAAATPPSLEPRRSTNDSRHGAGGWTAWPAGPPTTPPLNRSALTSTAARQRRGRAAAPSTPPLARQGTTPSRPRNTSFPGRGPPQKDSGGPASSVERASSMVRPLARRACPPRSGSVVWGGAVTSRAVPPLRAAPPPPPPAAADTKSPLSAGELRLLFRRRIQRRGPAAASGGGCGVHR